MTGYGANDMARSFRTVRENTIKIAEEIPADKYDFRPSEGAQSVRETLAHIAVTPRWQQQTHAARVTHPDFTNFAQVLEDFKRQEDELATKDQIVNALKTGGEEFAKWLESLTDEILDENMHFPAPMQPPTKTRFEMLLSVKEHEMHHRGQLMVVERLLGIVPHLTRRRNEEMAKFMEQLKQAQPA
jgi:uncharacterized damage-inducible protein DinB